LSAAGEGGGDFESLYQELYPRVVRTVFLTIFDRAVAQEIAHEAFLRLWQHRDKLGDGQNPRAWVMKVAVNLAIDHRRRLLTALRRRLAPTAAEDPADIALAHLDLEGVKRALMALPARERALLVLRFEQGLSFPEIGRILGRPEATVKTWLHRVLGRVQLNLDGPDSGWALDEAQ
jgi:RNA polymerase sigma-70 factor (ECF subfamily)